jgi:hypothetical protein
LEATAGLVSAASSAWIAGGGDARLQHGLQPHDHARHVLAHLDGGDEIGDALDFSGFGHEIPPSLSGSNALPTITRY